ncbi:MAG: hypothetical protein ABIH89_02335 [Elusimicrobiota bacterium]
MRPHKKKYQLWGKPFEKVLEEIRVRQKELEEKDLRDEIKRRRHRLKGA